MRNAGVTPVEDEVAPVTHVDLGVVKVVVLNRLRQAVRGELLAELVHARHTRLDSWAVLDRELDLVEEPLEAPGQHGETKVGDTETNQVVRRVSHVELQPGIEREDLEPADERALLLHDLAQPPPRVLHQQPATLEVDGEERRDAVRTALGEQRDERGLEAQRWRIRLEVDVAALRGHAQHGRPGPVVRLLDLAGRAGAELREPGVDPRVRLREPCRIRPRGLRHAREGWLSNGGSDSSSTGVGCARMSRTPTSSSAASTTVIARRFRTITPSATPGVATASNRP